MAQQVTPETLEFVRLLTREENEQRILNYLNRNVAHIDLAYQNREGKLVTLALPGLRKVAIRLLDLGAPIPTLNQLFEYLEDGFQPPLALSRDLMLKLIEKGFSKNDMLMFLCGEKNGTHLNLLHVLRDLGGVDFNYTDEDDYKPIGFLLLNYNDENRGTFMQMLRFLIENGANPNLIVNEEGQTAYESLEDEDIPNKGAIRRILDQFVDTPPAVAAGQAPAAPAAQALAQAPAQHQDYQQLWWEELMKKEPDLQKIREYAPHVDVNKTKQNMDDNPLTIAIQNKNINLLKTLLDLGANPNTKVGNYNKPVWMFCINNDKIGAPHNLNLQMLEEMRKKSADFTQKFMGDDAYVRIIRNVEAEKKIISYINYFLPYVDVTELSQYGNSILHMMMGIVDDTNIKRVLVEKGAPLESRDGKSVLRSFGQSDLISKTLMDAIFAKKRDPNYMALNMLWGLLLDASKSSYNLSKVVDILLSYNPDLNKVTDGITLLILMARIANQTVVNIRGELIQTFKKVIEKGADPNYVNSEGKTAADYITLPPNYLVELKEFLESFKHQEPKNTKPWSGFTKADIAFTNEVFHQVTHTQDLAIANPDQVLFSMCPVCLKYIEHASGSCMYMTHSCVEQSGFQGYYHKKLWATYSYEKQLFDARGNPAETKRVLEWCTLCGRICKDHKHYQLAKLYKEDGKTLKPVPGFAGAGDYFIVDCSKPSVGGGGLKEKVNRYRRFREVVLFLNDQVGDITFEDAINTLVEEVWEAPLAARRLEVNYALKKKAYNAAVANDRFPVPQAEPNQVFNNLAYPNATNTSLHPLVYAKAVNGHRNVMEHLSGDDENIVQFRHRMADGTINEHAGPNQQIALDNLMGYLKDMATQQTSADFGLCWQHADLYLTTIADEAHPPPKCTARLYPQEVLAAIEGSTYTDPAKKEADLQVYNAYRVAFNKKFGGPVAGGGNRRKTLRRRRA